MPIAEHLRNTNTDFAGSIDPAFLFFDSKNMREIESRAQLCFGVGAAERHRLVEAAKSPTRALAANSLGKIRFNLNKPASAAPVEFVGPPDRFSAQVRADIAAKKSEQVDLFRQQECNVVGSQTVIQYREWSNEWRIRTQVHGTVGTAPPEQSGLRISKMLSSGGARKIADSCEYMAKANGGFKTFVTGTFDEAARVRVALGHTTIQREATRALDALSKMYRRGWTTEAGQFIAPAKNCRVLPFGSTVWECGDVIGGAPIDGPATKIRYEGDPLAYCWVVEVPKNAEGADNPHLHMLLDWEVPYAIFREWSARIESIWGNGYFHLEKIDDPLCAGAYMAKAAGYLTKGAGQSDQGVVSGNRYAISKVARAPAWSTLGTYQLGIMGMLIRDVHDAISARHSEKFLQRHRLREQREQVRAKAKAAAVDGQKYPLWAKNALTDIGAQLTAVRAEINALPVRASKYQLVIKGADHFERFIAWATECGWHWKQRPASHWMARFRVRLFERKKRRSAVDDKSLAAWCAEQAERIASACNLSAWFDYSQLERG